ncbi:unnamed protein product [Durusdinium trenchii]|uniref:Uncharacterized protein n=1 Tax=Durusdinium trenchii TaxID=1381693 RepID=A0ABP0LQK4_9DINO
MRFVWSINLEICALMQRHEFVSSPDESKRFAPWLRRWPLAAWTGLAARAKSLLYEFFVQVAVSEARSKHEAEAGRKDSPGCRTRRKERLLQDLDIRGKVESLSKSLALVLTMEPGKLLRTQPKAARAVAAQAGQGKMNRESDLVPCLMSFFHGLPPSFPPE